MDYYCDSREFFGELDEYMQSFEEQLGIEYCLITYIEDILISSEINYPFKIMNRVERNELSVSNLRKRDIYLGLRSIKIYGR